MSLLPESPFLEFSPRNKPAIEPLPDLSASDVTSRKLVCQLFEEIIFVELARAGYVAHYKRGMLDSGMLFNLKIVDALRHRQRAWRSMTLTRTMSLVFRPDRDPKMFAFRGGVLAIGYVGEPTQTFDAPAMLYGGVFFSEVDIYNTRSKNVANQHRRYKLPWICTGLELDPAQDLLVVWHSLKPLHWQSGSRVCEERDKIREKYGSTFAFLSLSNATQGFAGRAHYDEYGVKISGDHITLIDRYTSWGDTIVCNWKDMKSPVYKVGYNRDCMLNNVCLLKPRDTYYKQPAGGGSASFDVFAKSGNVNHLVANFELPMLRSHVKCKISQCDTFRTNDTAIHSFEDAPPILLSTSPTPSMLQLRLVLYHNSPHNPVMLTEYMVFVYTKPFLHAVSNFVSGKQATREVDTIPWKQWGPSSSFWFKHGSSVEDLFHEEANKDGEERYHKWKNACYGFRVLLPSVMLDFTPLDADEREDRRLHGHNDIRTGTDIDKQDNWFKSAACTTAAYRQTKIKGTPLGKKYTWYILDEDILAISSYGFLSMFFYCRA
ncbi:predicted protein [Postia placenta Mad-698-R]|uniref:Uncharacterized protein n=1 Tax=Postia placenta MAD-698-R-SB12 TaxID=670580 RepID=A0A1X6NDX1_9APHY|nr:hypothetical protein POSPLADRAFT_1044002 [Postia placenta MAD-698-R-SB12]EED79403.1 predicted protein [Postia placenta Mad-698-R]OSX66626.1 hypothetical protein POSPLADRAFT_1044002 [Postia placenta MAD-698-R-SB12]